MVFRVHWGKRRVPRAAWSRIKFSPTRKLLRDPDSRFHLLMEHRSVSHKSTKPAAGQVFVSFVRGAGIEPATYPTSRGRSTK